MTEVHLEVQTDALEHDWARLHPLSPVVQFGRGLVLLVIVLGPRLLAGGSISSNYTDLGIVAAGLVGGFVHWLVTRWRVVGSELQIETGLIRRQSIRIPLSRVQTVDLVRPALGRVFGLAEVRVETAGQGSGKGRLAYLPDGRATAVRAQLLALAHGLPDHTPTPEGVPVWRVDNGRLVVSALLGGPTLVIIAWVVGISVTASESPRHVAGVVGSLLPVLIAAVSVLGRRVLAEWGWSVEVAGDGLRLHGGLLQTRTQTIPAGRVQAVRCTQPLLWRAPGWYRLEVDIARQKSGRRGSESDSRRVSRALVPVGWDADVDVLLGLLMPDVRWQPGLPDRPPRRALVKAPLSYPTLATWADGACIAARTGRLRRTTVVVPLAKIQSVRIVEGPVQRALRVATVHVDIAGRGWHVVARCRDRADAVALWTSLSERARDARGTVAGQSRREDGHAQPR